MRAIVRSAAWLTALADVPLRTFSFWVANGSVGNPLIEGIDYWDALRESPSLMEEAYAIFVNVLEFDETGVPVNAKYAEFRRDALAFPNVRKVWLQVDFVF